MIGKAGAIKRHHIWTWIGVALLLVMAAAAATQIPVRAYANLTQHWIGTFGPWGVALFIPCFIVAALFAPTTPLTVLAGFAFGLSVGLPVVLFSAGVSATATFLLSRYLLRSRVIEAIAGKPRFQALDRTLVDSGWRIIILSQLSPFIPFNVQNLFYGLSNITLRVFILATLAGVLPGAAFYVYLGAVGRVVTHRTMGPMQWIPLVVGLIATALLLLLISRAARVRLSEATDSKEHGS